MFVISLIDLLIDWWGTIFGYVSSQLMAYIERDLMAQRLARRAEDREVPGSSPTQD